MDDDILKPTPATIAPSFTVTQSYARTQPQAVNNFGAFGNAPAINTRPTTDPFANLNLNPSQADFAAP